MSEDDSDSKSVEETESGSVETVKSESEKKDVESKPPLYYAEGLLKNEDDDDFHHIEVVDVLETAILRSKDSINIALYGGWGIGKSTIINFLDARVNSKKEFKDYQHVVIDAWKLSPEVLRSELLEELALQLGISKEEREKIYDTLHNVTEVDEAITPTRGDKIKKWLFHLIPIYPIPGAIIAYYVGQYYGLDLSTHALWGIIAGPLILGIPKLFSEISKTTERSSKRIIQKAESSHKFKEIFDKILKAKKKNRIIITIDNLDRCDEKSAVRILSSVKTFMGNEDCIYVVPCDESALLHHLEREYDTGENPQHAKEFLRKFFQIIINVPPNIKSDLSGYVDSLMKKFPDIPFDSHVNEILISGGLSNPRKIRQYLYNLSVQYQLADLREKNPEDILTTGIITTNTGFLTKLIVIRDEWPTVYEKLHGMPTLLNSYHDFLREPTRMSDELKNEVFEDFDKFPDFAKFMRATSLIVVDDIRPFLNLSQEPYETKHGGFEQINLHASQNNLDDLKQDLSTLTPEEILSSFKGLLSLIKYHIDNKDSQYAFNVMNCLLELYEKIPEELHNVLLEKFSNYLSSTPELRQSMNHFDSEKIFSLIMKMNSLVKEQLLSEYCTRLTQFRPVDLEIIKQFVIYSNELSQTIKEKFDDEVNRLGSSDEKEFVKVVQTLSKTEQGLLLIGPEILRALAGRIGTQYTPDNELKASLFFQSISNASLEAKKEFVQRLLGDINPDKITALDDNSRWILDKLFEYLQSQSDCSDIVFNRISKLIPKLQNHDHKLAVLKVIFKLLPNIPKTSIENFAKTDFSINALVQNHPQLQQILTLSKETNSQLLSYDSIFAVMLTRLTALAPNADAYAQFIQETPYEKLDQVIDMLQNKISSFDPNQLNIILSSLTKSKEQFSSDQFDLLIHDVIDRLNKYPFDQNNAIFGKLFEILDTFSPKLLSDSADAMMTWLATNNPPQMNKAQSYLNKILGKTSSDKKHSLFEKLLNTLSTKLSKNQLDMANIVSPIVFDNIDSFDDSLKEKLIDLLCLQLVSGKPAELQNSALEKLSELGVVNNKIQHAIYSLRKSTDNGNVQKLCNDTCIKLGIPFLSLKDPFEISGGKHEDGQISKNLTKRLTVVANEDGTAYIEYDVGVNMGPKKNKTACSDVKLHIYAGENEIYTSDWLGYPNRPDNELPLSTGIVKLDGLEPGKCELQIVPEGREGGCNDGFIGNWNGVVSVYETQKSVSKK